ncbi:hypothetical protein Tdes44962_MAKER07263, partial [Teratosphaeria destructans]
AGGGALDVEVVPGVLGAGEALEGGGGGEGGGQAAGDDGAAGGREEDAVHVVVEARRADLVQFLDRLAGGSGGVVREFDEVLGLDQLQLQQRRHAQGPESACGTVEEIALLVSAGPRHRPGREHDLDPVDRVVEEPVLEPAAFSRRAGETAPGGDAGELHDDFRDQTVREGGVDELVHGDVGLDDAGFGCGVDLEDVVELTGVDHAGGIDFVDFGGVG